MRQESQLCQYGSLQSHRGFLHLPRCCDWQCHRDGNFFQERQGSIHWDLDVDGYHRSPDCSLHIWICCERRWLSLDLLDSGNGETFKYSLTLISDIFNSSYRSTVPSLSFTSFSVPKLATSVPRVNIPGLNSNRNTSISNALIPDLFDSETLHIP